MHDIDIPEVTALRQQARFYREGEQAFIEISYVGDNGTVVKKVQPEHMANFREEWNAFCDGVPLKRRSGTALTIIMDEPIAEKYINQNVHTVEELSFLSDGQCQVLGHGTLTLRQKARDLLSEKKRKQVEEVTKRISDVANSVQTLPEQPDPRYASKGDLDEVKNMLAQLIEMQRPKKPGRPKKDA